MTEPAHAWDHLAAPTPDEPDERDGTQPSLVTLVAASWGDLASMLAVCTTALVMVNMLGHRAGLPALPWSVALAAAWWCAAAAVTTVVRRGSPGMLLAGLCFEQAVPPRRLAPVLAAALLQGCCFGLPALVGPRYSPLRLASGQRLLAQREE